MKRVKTIRFLILAVLVIGLTSLTLIRFNVQYIKVNPRLYVSRFEVTNSEYREFLNSSAEARLNFLYDSVQWTKKFPFAFNEPLLNFYHWHPAYKDYPVVNISMESALAYCSWLTQQYNSRNKKFKKVIFRLPTEQEWIGFAGLTDPANISSAGNKKTAVANVKIPNPVEGGFDYKFDGFIYTAKVGSFRPNSLGISDMEGNVFELTSTGVQKGGSWDSLPEECITSFSEKLDIPDPRVGFRVVMEVIEE